MGARVAVAVDRENQAGKCKIGKVEIACDNLYDLEDLANLHAWIGL